MGGKKPSSMSRRSHRSKQARAPSEQADEGLLVESLRSGMVSAHSEYINPADASKMVTEAHLDIRSKMRAGTGVIFSEGTNVRDRGMGYVEKMERDAMSTKGNESRMRLSR